MWFSQQSGVIAYSEEKNSIVLITSRRKKRWIIPKGYIEEKMHPAESAAREALEEAGVIGSVSYKELGCYHYSKKKSFFKVKVYLLKVKTLLNKWDESVERRRILVSPEAAIELIKEQELKDIIRHYFLRERIDTPQKNFNNRFLSRSISCQLN